MTLKTITSLITASVLLAACGTTSETSDPAATKETGGSGIDLAQFLNVAEFNLPRLETQSVTDFFGDFQAAGSAPADVDQGQAGYQGNVVDLTEVPALTPPNGAIQAFRVRVTRDQSRFVILGTVQAAPAGGETHWLFRINSIDDGGRRLASVNPPVAATQTSLQSGRSLKEMTLSFPALAETGNAVPRRGSPEYRAITGALGAVAIHVSSTDLGDDKRLNKAPALVQRMVDVYGNPTGGPISGQLAGTADNGDLLAIWDQSVSWSSDKSKVTYDLKGYALIDPASGLARESALRLTKGDQVTIVETGLLEIDQQSSVAAGLFSPVTGLMTGFVQVIDTVAFGISDAVTSTIQQGGAEQNNAAPDDSAEEQPTQ